MLSRIKNLLLPAVGASNEVASPPKDLATDYDQYVDVEPASPMTSDGGSSIPEEHTISDTYKACLQPNPCFEIGTVFFSLTGAKNAAVELCKCPVVQRSVRQHTYVYFECFRSGKPKGAIGATTQRKAHSKKCSCPFKATVKKSVEGYRVISIVGEHNHELYTEEELQELPQSRFIPQEVQEKIVSLFRLGNLNISQIMTLIEKEHFPDVKVTWTKRDVQNLTQKVSDRAKEATDFLSLLEEKSNSDEGWCVRCSICPETFRLNKVFWMSSAGRAAFQKFSDVVEGDATYQTNRFGMPLVLFTVVDSNGLTCLAGGALISDETRDTYTWVLKQLKDCTKTEPKVFFTDGDVEFANAISSVFPNTVHLLCRWHIAQNITRKLAGDLRKELNLFLDAFWEVGSLEDVDQYVIRWEQLKEEWAHSPKTVAYMETLQDKQEKWAFAFTHNHFVAGISSTQRQESVNYQTKCDLISNSTLSQLVTCFENMDNRLARKMAMATLNTKLSCSGSDPIIQRASTVLTGYAAEILREECTLSLSYICEVLKESEVCIIVKCSHHENPTKFRIVRFEKSSPLHYCSCRKNIWHGIVCRHVIAVLRKVNVLDCPLEMFDIRWTREFSSTLCQNNLHVERALSTVVPHRAGNGNANVTAERISHLSSIAKIIISRCIYEETHFERVRSSFVSLQQVIEAATHE